MNKAEIIALAEKVASGLATEQELIQYNSIYNHFQPGSDNWDENILGNKHITGELIKESITKKIYRGRPAISMNWKRWVAAASVVFALGIGSYLLFFKKPIQSNQIVKVPEAKDVQAPKGTKAKITLADGRTISVDSLTTINQASVKLTKTADGKIIYSGSTSKVVFNTLSNPRGSKVIDMTLSDGSHVWLNAGSSIIYPIAFTGNYRKVFITGEAYLEVEHNTAKPFIVNANNKGEIEVLGTHFNVNVYDDEEAVRTTLLEGKVKFTRTKLSLPTSDFLLLSPGQQAVLTSNGLRVANDVDIEGVMAWKNGYFHFGNTSLRDLMKQLSRWYDIDVEYQGKVVVREFGGEISREANLSQVLKILNESKVKCRIEGRKLIVE